MPAMTDIGFLLFWLGFILAYAGTLWLPSQTSSPKNSVRLLLGAAVVGWAAMLAASYVFDYGQAWLDMPASYIFAGGCAVAGWMIARLKPRPKQ